MARPRIVMEDFPDSHYARELRRRKWHLRFCDALEPEYIALHVERIRLRARVWYSLSVALTAYFAVRRARSFGVGNAESLLDVSVLLPCIITLAWLSWARRLAAWFLPFARLLAPLYFVVVAAMIAPGVARGDDQTVGLTLNVLAVFFLSGLTFGEAAPTAAMMVVAFLISGLYFHVAAAQLVAKTVMLALTALVGIIAHRDLDKSYRNGFLESDLIGELVARDGLTGLMNRRTFDEHMLRVWQHAMRHRQTLAVMMIDIDHFKEFNDGLGHQAGDAALRRVAQSIQGFARRSLDLAARFGGEEFAVIIYDAPLQHVRELAEGIRRSVCDLRIGRPDSNPDAAVTVSIGVGLVAPTIGRTPHGAVQLADEALYEAKRLGRNCVVIREIEAYRLLDTGEFKAGRAASLARTPADQTSRRGRTRTACPPAPRRSCPAAGTCTARPGRR